MVWPSSRHALALASPHEIFPGSLPASDLALVSQWINLNRDVIIEFWDGVIDFDQVAPRLRRL